MLFILQEIQTRQLSRAYKSTMEKHAYRAAADATQRRGLPAFQVRGYMVYPVQYPIYKALLKAG